MTVEHHELPTKVTCPFCAKIHDCAMGVSEDPGAPDPGDINICINCERISVYTDAGGLRIPTDDELAIALDNDDVVKALKALNRSHYHIKKWSN